MKFKAMIGLLIPIELVSKVGTKGIIWKNKN